MNVKIPATTVGKEVIGRAKTGEPVISVTVELNPL